MYLYKVTVGFSNGKTGAEYAIAPDAGVVERLVEDRLIKFHSVIVSIGRLASVRDIAGLEDYTIEALVDEPDPPMTAAELEKHFGLLQRMADYIKECTPMTDEELIERLHRLKPEPEPAPSLEETVDICLLETLMTCSLIDHLGEQVRTDKMKAGRAADLVGLFKKRFLDCEDKGEGEERTVTWIPISERLPEHSKMVLVLNATNQVKDVTRYRRGAWASTSVANKTHWAEIEWGNPPGGNSPQWADDLLWEALEPILRSYA